MAGATAPCMAGWGGWEEWEWEVMEEEECTDSRA